MRRKDREVTDREEIIEVLEKCKVCRLVFHDNLGTHIVPMSFGYEFKENLILYFHGAKSGRRADILLDKSTKVWFEIDYNDEFIADVEKYFFTVKYGCVIGEGMSEIVEDVHDKQVALNTILQHQMNMNTEIPDRILNNVMVFKIDVENFSCKKN